MLNGWHVRWVCWPCKNWDVFSFQEFCTDPCTIGPCIIMLQHEVMVVDEWHNYGPQDLVMLSLCIQNAINKMHMCLLSITYACPYHNPTATMGHSIHNVDIRKPLTHMTHTRCLPYALYSENRDSSVKRTQIKSNHFYCHLRACSRQCINNLHKDSTYLQTYTDDNVQNTHTYTQYTQCTIRDTYIYQYTLYTLCTHSILYVYMYIYTLICKGVTDYT